METTGRNMMSSNVPSEVVLLGRLPQSLQAWLDETTLIQLVLEAITEGPEPVAGSDGRGGQESARRPQILLGILTYAYAIGVFSSEEIAWRIASDPSLRYLAAGSDPSAFQLRRFRRRWRLALHQSLACLFQMAWQVRGTARDSEWRSFIEGGHDVDGAQGVRRQCVREAEERISRAVQLDSMELDI